MSETRRCHELHLTPEQIAAIEDHARGTYPEECCGILLGTTHGSGDEAQGDTGASQAAVVTVEQVVEVANRRASEDRHNRYLIEPEAVMSALSRARAEGLDIIGYYHSHPDHPSRPSDFDRDHAWPNTSYLIVSVMRGAVADRRSWRLREDRSSFDEEALSLQEQEPAGAC